VTDAVIGDALEEYREAGGADVYVIEVEEHDATTDVDQRGE
jgi:prephenate dehydrogenase